MAEITLKTHIRLRRGNAAEWAEVNPVLLLGEPGVEIDTNKMKIGDGEKTWNELSYFAEVEQFEIPGLETAEIGQIAVKGEDGFAWKDEIIPMSQAEIKALIAQAIANANKGVANVAELRSAFAETGVIKLGADLALGAEPVVIPVGADVVLNLADHKLTGGESAIQVNGGTLTIQGESGEFEATGRAVVVKNGGKVILESGKVTSTGHNGIGAVGEGSEIIINGGEVEGQEYGLNVVDGAKLEINGGIIEANDNCAVGGNGSLYVDANGNLTTKVADAVREQLPIEIIMNGGELISNIQSRGWIANGVYMPGSCNFTMNGGTIKANGGAGIIIRAGQATLNGGKIITTTNVVNSTGKAGDSKITNVPCAPIVWDKSANYPKADTMALVIGSAVQFEKPSDVGKLELLPADADMSAITLPVDWDNEAPAAVE